MAATTTLLGLVTPTQGTLSGTWGDTVNYGISDYVDISVAGTLTLTNDGAVTLANTTGSSSGNSITSSLTGAGTVTAQFAIVRVTGTLTVAKVVTAPSYSKTYTVVNAATGGIVTFKASGQTGVSVAVGESAFVYFNGTDYVKLAGTAAVSSFSAGTTGLTPSTATTGAVTLAGTLATTNGGTGLTSFTSGGVVYASSTSALATGSALVFDGTNLGLGVTPSAWGSGSKGFQVLKGGLWHDNSQYFSLVNNAYYDGTNWKYISTAASSQIAQINGESRFYNAASGTAGDTISFTQAMTLDVSGNLGIGTSSPAYKLDLYTTANFAGRWANATRGGYLYLDSGGPGIFNTAAYGSEGIYFHAGSNYTAFLTNSAERMRIDSSGSVGIGTSSPNNNLEVLSSSNPSIAVTSTSASLYCYYGMTAGTVGGTLFTFGQSYSAVYPAGSTALANNTYGVILNASNATGILRFQTNDTERARIDSSGNVGIGTSSPSYRLDVFQSGSVNVFQVQGNATDGSNLARYHQSANSGDNGFIAFLTETSPTSRGSITYNRAGGLTAYNTTSDYRAKDITGPVTGSGALIDSVPVYMGKMKDATQERPMFLAHETPNYAHTGVKDAVDADGNPVYQQMDASALIPVMWAEIQSLRQRLSAANL